MARPCKDCGLDLDRYAEPRSDKHRCVGGRIVRKPTQLEAERITKGELDPTILVQPPKPSAQPVGRLAPRKSTVPLIDGHLSRQPTQPSLADVLAAIEDFACNLWS